MHLTKTGRVYRKNPGPARRTDLERFEGMIDRSAHGGCWTWLGKVSEHGYGLFSIRVGGRWKGIQARRYAYSTFVKPVPLADKDRVCHISNGCKNPLCVNPEHLVEGSYGPTFEQLIDKAGPRYKNMGRCWIWRGRTMPPSNYGNYKSELAHRHSWELYNGTIPDGLHVCHHCDNPRCVNPRHLFLGTVLQNRRDSVNKDRHARGERQPQAKTTDAEVRAIRKRYKKYSRKDGTGAIARDYGMKPTNVWRIVNRRRWRHVK